MACLKRIAANFTIVQLLNSSPLLYLPFFKVRNEQERCRIDAERYRRSCLCNLSICTEDQKAVSKFVARQEQELYKALARQPIQ